MEIGINIKYECFERLKRNNSEKFKLNLFYKELKK